MSNKKKILHLITGLEVGGAEMMLLKTLPHLQRDFDNRVCCIRGRGPMAERLETAGVPVYYLGLKNILDVGIIFRFRRIIQDFNPEILVTYLIHADLFGRIFGRMFGTKKIICNQRGSLQQWKFLRFFDRLTKCLVTKYIVQTEVAKRKLMWQLHLSEEKFVVIPNAISISEYEFTLDNNKKKKELGINIDNKNIVCVSNLHKGKGHEYLLQAFENVYQNIKNINLLLVGDGNQRVALENQIKGYTSKGNIYFLGKRSDVKEILKISDLFILATEGEGMSNAIMEAMASGLPVISTDISENRILIKNGYSGILIPSKDVNSLIRAIYLLINDLKNHNILGSNAKNHIINFFNLPAILNRIRDLYSSI